jgi:ribosomal protein L37AE/L43A
MSNQDNQRLNNCKSCNSKNSKNTTYDHNHGFWECQDCGELWAYNIDDPDWMN